MKTQQGFTLLEILVVIAIVGLIGGMVSIRFLRVNQVTAVEDSALTLAAHLKEARSRSLSGQISSGASSWGIYINPAVYPNPLLFVDVDQDSAFSSGDTAEDIFLDENTAIGQCLIGSTVVPDCGVLFSSPSGEATVFTLGGTPPAPFNSLSAEIRSVSDSSIVDSVVVSAPTGLVITSVEL